MLSAAFFRVDNFSMTKAGTKLDRQNMDSATRLQMILVDSPVGVVLPARCCKQQRFAIAFLNLPNWWLAGGAVRNTVWRSLFGNDCQLIINDFDIAFFDALGDRSKPHSLGAGGSDYVLIYYICNMSLLFRRLA